MRFAPVQGSAQPNPPAQPRMIVLSYSKSSEAINSALEIPALEWARKQTRRGECINLFSPAEFTVKYWNCKPQFTSPKSNRRHAQGLRGNKSWRELGRAF